MRSVFLHLRQASESEVAEVLRGLYPRQAGPPWIAEVEGDACLYVNFDAGGASEQGPDEWARLVGVLGGEPSVSLQCDVSGRYPGDEQVSHFVTEMLSRFGGAAQDDFTPHLWSLNEIRSGHREEGHTFFDYTGWWSARRT